MFLHKIVLLCLPIFTLGANNCNRVRVDRCAILYDEEGCNGWALPVGEGLTELGIWKRNDAESIVVKRGCTLMGFDHANKRGRSVTIDASRSLSDLAKDLNGRDDLEEQIHSVTCICSSGVGSSGSYGNNVGSSGSYGNNVGSSGSYGNGIGSSGSNGNGIGSSGSYGNNVGSSGSYGNSIGSSGSYGNNVGSSGSYGNSIGSSGSYGNGVGSSGSFNNNKNNRPYFGNSNSGALGSSGSFNTNRRTGNSNSNCDRVTFQPNIACIVYDKGDCKVSSWSSPEELRPGQSKSYSILSSLGNFQYKNTIESVSVKAGCSLEVFRDSDFSDTRTVFTATRTGDLHETLNRDQKYKRINNDIESLRCSC